MLQLGYRACDIRLPLRIGLLLTIATLPCLSQTAGRIDNVQVSNATAMVSGVLHGRQNSLSMVETGTNDLISNYEEFRSYLLPYRARFRFHLEGSSLFITMEDLQSSVNGGWNHSLFPATAAEAKLIVQVVAQLKAANYHMADIVSSDRGGQSLSESQPLVNAKSLVFDDISSRCREGLCAIRKDGLWGFIDYQGNLILDFQYQSDDAPIFSQGMCVVGNRPLHDFKYIDRKGNVLFGGKAFISARPFIDNVAIVRQGDPAGDAMLDFEGHIVELSSDVLANNDFHNGLIITRAQKGEGFGFRNLKMQLAIPPVYAAVQSFSEGIAWVASVNAGGMTKWGAIDTNGKLIIPFMFSQSPHSFSDGLAVVACTNQKFGYVNVSGTLALDCQFSQANPFLNGRAFVWGAGGEMLIDKHGAVVADGKGRGIPPAAWSSLNLREDGLFYFMNAYHGMLDENWNLMIRPTFLDIGVFPSDDAKGLAWAASVSQNGQTSRGFINRQGEFVLLQQDSKF